MEKNKQSKSLNIRFSDEDWRVLNELCELYNGMDKTSMVRHSLRHVLKTRPKFVLSPVDVKVEKV